MNTATEDGRGVTYVCEQCGLFNSDDEDTVGLEASCRQCRRAYVVGDAERRPHFNAFCERHNFTPHMRKAYAVYLCTLIPDHKMAWKRIAELVGTEDAAKLIELGREIDNQLRERN